jgi:PKD repeat protein
LNVAGGIAPYTWSITKGALPPGLTLSAAGLINGTIGAEGIFNFTATATDSSGGAGPYAGNLPLTIAVNHAPVFASAPSATPNSAAVNQTVQFSAVATDADGNALTYRWDFIDGTTSALQNPTHTFTVAGAHTVVLTVNDLHGGQVTGTVVVNIGNAAPFLAVDTDGDGYSDEIETALGSNPNDPKSTPFGLPALTGTGLVTVSGLNVNVQFNKFGNDMIVLTGTVPLPPTFQAAGQYVIADIGGVVSAFKLQKTGKAKPVSTAKTASLSFASVTKKSTATNRSFTLALKKGDFSATLSKSSGLTSAVVANVSLNVQVTVIVNDHAYLALVPVTYTTSNAGTLGKAVYP